MPGWIDNKDQIESDVIPKIHNVTIHKPADPSGILGASEKMLGLGGDSTDAVTFKPTRTGNIKVSVTCNITDDTTADLGTWKLRYGTGTAPANGGATTGSTAVTPNNTWTALTGMTSVPFSEITYITGLTVGTTYWFDFGAVATGAGATVGMNKIVFVIEEF